jgi:predicted HD phosphohydrolase
VTGPASSVDELLDVLALGAGSGEDQGVTHLQHALQCADKLAALRPDDLELQAAGLLHDIGHVLEPDDRRGHGGRARRHVEPLLGPRVGALVELHVTAKRWLVTVEPDYRHGLSRGSARSLILQGDALTAGDRAAFEAHPHHADAVLLRRADETAKVPGLAASSLERWRPVLDALR